MAWLACTPCQAGTYQSASCDQAANVDNTCAGEQRIIKGPLVANLFLVACSSFANCLSVSCTNATDSQCLACNASFYHNGSSCESCTTCGSSQYAASACNGTMDTVCAGIGSTVGSSHCSPGHALQTAAQSTTVRPSPAATPLPFARLARRASFFPHREPAPNATTHAPTESLWLAAATPSVTKTPSAEVIAAHRLRHLTEHRLHQQRHELCQRRLCHGEPILLRWMHAGVPLGVLVRVRR